MSAPTLCGSFHPLVPILRQLPHMEFLPQDWSTVFVPEGPLLELFVRGTCIYFILYAFMRFGGRRLFAQLNMSDVLIVLLLAVAVRSGLTGGYNSVGDAAIVAGTLLFWNRVVDRLAYHFAWFRSAMRHAPVQIIRDGSLIVENARSNLLTRTEIMERVREHGASSIGEVKEAFLEQDGSLSVVQKSGDR